MTLTLLPDEKGATARDRARNIPMSCPRLCRLLLIVAGVLSCAGGNLKPSIAGSYTVSYSGGSTVFTAPGSGANVPYAGGYSGWGSSYRGFGIQPGTVSCKSSGQITATFTWNNGGDPTDLPPKSVIIKERSKMEWKADAAAVQFTGNCADGLSSAVKIPANVLTGPRLGRSDVTGWSIRVDPGASFTVTADPVAEVSASVSTPPIPSAVSTILTYSAIAQPVQVFLRGTIRNQGKENILVGQMCQGTLTSGSSASLAEYHWGVGGDTFARFERANDSSWGHAVPVADDEWTKPEPLWCWRKEEDSLTITANAKAYIDNQLIGTVWGEIIIKVHTPYYGLIVHEPYGTTSLTSDGTVASVTDSIPGISVEAAVGTPALFRSIGGGFRDAGSAFFAQLCKISRIKLPVLYGYNTVLGEFCLDNQWPYIDGFASSSESFRVPIYFTDIPSTDVRFVNSFSVHDYFKLYLMYEPPYNSVGVQPVTLHRVHWHWTASSARSFIGPFVYGPWTPDPPTGGIGVELNEQSTEHPFWEAIHSNK